MAQDNKQVTLGKIIFTIIYISLFPALVLTLSGDLFWLEGWIFGIWFLTLCLASIIYLYRKDERANFE
jgi:hypothetical protein